MTVWFTADLHLGHGNIIKYCQRPFRDAEHMNTWLVRAWNQRVKPEDTVLHLGDFCCRGRERGVPGVATKAESWEQVLNGKIIHIRGNHDANNSVKVALDEATIEFNGMSWLLRHRPLYQREEIPKGCAAVLCGHVHEKWKHIIVEGIPVINVGVDARNYMPISKAEVAAVYYRIIKGNKK